MMLEILGSLVTGVLSGGATGLMGVALKLWGESSKRKTDVELLRLQHQNAVDLRKLDIEAQQKLTELNQAGAERLAQIEAETRALQAASDDYQASMVNDKATYLSAGAQDWAKVSGWWPRLVTGLVVLAMSLVDFLRGLIRPGATAYTLALQTALLWWVGDLYRQRQLTLSAGQQAELVMLVVGTTSYLCTTCVVWWFGARPQSRR